MSGRRSAGLRILVLVFLLGDPLAAWARGRGGIQRMALAPGRFSVSPGRPTRVPAYCLDPLRTAPTPRTSMANLLTSPESIMVRRRNGVLVPGPEALSTGLLRVRGRRSEQSELLRTILEGMAAGLSPSERAEMQRLLRESEGDFANLHLESSEPIEVVVGPNAIVGERPEAAPRNVALPPSSARPSDATRATIQTGIWKERTQSDQEHLVGLGYNPGPIDGQPGRRTLAAHEAFQADQGLEEAAVDAALADRGQAAMRHLQSQLSSLGLLTSEPDGVVGPKTRAAAKEYQRARGLPESGLIDVATAGMLQEESLGATIEAVNKRSLDSRVLAVQRRPRDSGHEYVLSDGGEALYRGNSAADLSKELEKQLDAAPDRQVFLELAGMPRNRAESLVENIVVTGAGREGRVRLLDRLQLTPETRNLLFSPVREVKFGEIQSDANGFATRAEIFTSGANPRGFLARIWSSTRETLVAFRDALLGVFGRAPERPLIDLVAAARAETRRNLGLTEKQLSERLRVEIDHVQIVDWTLPSAARSAE